MFNDVEQSILDRLTTGLAAQPEVSILQQSQVKDGDELRQKAPFVAVIYDGYTLGDDIAQGIVQQIKLDWWVMIGTKSAQGRGKNIKASADNGILAKQVLQLLLGYRLKKPDGQPSGAYLRLRESPGPEYQDGYCYLPIGFTSAVTFTGTP
jgi:hypothetical protein